MSESIRRQLRRALPLLLAASAAGLSLYFARAQACSIREPRWSATHCEQAKHTWDGEQLSDAQTRERLWQTLRSGRAQYWSDSARRAAKLRSAEKYQVAQALAEPEFASRRFNGALLRLAVCAPNENVDLFKAVHKRLARDDWQDDHHLVAALGLLRAGDRGAGDSLLALIEQYPLPNAFSRYPLWLVRSGDYRMVPQLLQQVDRIGKPEGAKTTSTAAISMRSTLINIIPDMADSGWRAQLNAALVEQLGGLSGTTKELAFGRLTRQVDPRYFDAAVLDWMLAEHFAAPVAGDDANRIPDETLLRLGLAAEPEPGPEDLRALDNLSCTRFSVRQEHWRDAAMVKQWRRWSLSHRDDVSRWHWSRTDEETMTDFQARLRQQMDVLLEASLTEEQWLSALTLAKRRYLRLGDEEMLPLIRDLLDELPLQQAAWAEQFLISHADGAGTEYLEALAASDKRTDRLMAAEVLASIPNSVWQTRSAPQSQLCAIAAQVNHDHTSMQHCDEPAEGPSHVE